MLSVHNIKLSFGSRTVLDDISLSLLPKDRVALVGQNGVGKSSLLKILAGEQADSGTIEKGKHVRIGILKQIPNLDNEISVLETVRLGMASHLEDIALHQRLCDELGLMSPSEPRDKLMATIDRLTEKIERAGGFDVEYWIERVLNRLGVSARAQKIGTLSGGEKRRVDLARILLLAPDIYLLDEPTNHLDVNAIKFLVETFSKSSSAVLFISHDSLFIDELATRIVELAGGKLFVHEPPFANYLENKLVRELIDERSLHRRERLVVGELSWLRAGIPARTTKQNARIERAYNLIDKVAKDSQSLRVKRLEMETAKAKRLGNTILELQEVGARFGDRVLFKGFNLKVTSGQRYGILGPNGSGKTTLLSIISKTSKPSFGNIIFGKNTEIIIFDQHREQLDPSLTLKETLADHGDYVRIDEKNIHIASYLEKYLFSPSDAERSVSTLSGGEQNRLLLAKLFRQSANCLLLDEPTNDLDVESLAVLEEILSEYQGVVFIVSHDRRFLDKIATSIIAFEPNAEDAASKLMVYPGNFSDYLHLKAQFEGLSDKSGPSIKKAIKTEKIKEKRRRSFKEEREFEEIEGIIDGLEKERVDINNELASAEFFRNEREKVQVKLERLRGLEIEIEKLYGRWQELMDMGG